jgi:carbonic anhydrase/acetyltransferase-like protein (isoleucine patch superfamily)
MKLTDRRGQLWSLYERHPRVNTSASIASGAHVIGNVEIGEDSSVWFNAVLRGDLEPIVIGRGSNIQDGAILHTDEGFPCVIGNNAIIHGATIEDEALVGMGAVVLSGAKLGKGAVLGAGAVLAEGKEIPAGMLALGVPAKVVRPIEPGDGGAFYRNNAQRFLQQLEGFTQERQQTKRSEQ